MLFHWKGDEVSSPFLCFAFPTSSSSLSCKSSAQAIDVERQRRKKKRKKAWNSLAHTSAGQSNQPSYLLPRIYIFFVQRENHQIMGRRRRLNTARAQLMHTSRKEKKKQQQNVKSSGISISMGGGRAEASSRRLLLYIERPRETERISTPLLLFRSWWRKTQNHSTAHITTSSVSLALPLLMPDRSLSLRHMGRSISISPKSSQQQ